MVVFACITTEGYINTPYSPEAKCIFNQTDSACSYAVGIGVIAFLACVAFLLLDVYVPFMSNAQERKYVVMADMGFSGNAALESRCKQYILITMHQKLYANLICSVPSQPPAVFGGSLKTLHT